jgi:hypothetical protein
LAVGFYSKDLAMKTTQKAAFLSVLVLAAATAWAQNPSQAEEAPTPVKVTVVFKQYQGGKLISNLPYVLSVSAAQHFSYNEEAHLRMGLRVPMRFASGITFADVGTEIDCGVKPQGNGSYLVEIAASLQGAHGMPVGTERATGPSTRATATTSASHGSPPSDYPITDNAKMNARILMRDGQTVQSLMATDPVTGRVLKVDVTLNVVK